MKSKYKIVIIDDDELAVDNLVFELTINARNMYESDVIDSAQELIYA